MPTAEPAPNIQELVARTDAGLLVVHDAGPVRVESVVLHEPGGRQRIPPHALVLAVGYQERTELFDRLVAAAAEAHAGAVVAKPSTVGPDALRVLGEQHGVSTVVAEQSADWLALASRFRSAAAVSAVDAVAGIRVGDLFAFANAVALAAGGATAIVDPAGRLLGFSNRADQPLDELRRRSTLLMAEEDSPAEDPDYRRLYASDACIHIPGRDGGFDRVAIAVRSDREILGSIWVLVPTKQKKPQAERALRQLAEPAAVHLHHARAELDVQRARHSQLLQALLLGETGAAGAAAGLGLSDRTWFRLAILVPDPGHPASISQRQVRSVTNWLSIVHADALFAEVNSRLVMLFSGKRVEDWPYLERDLDRFLRNSDAVRGALAAVTSLPVATAPDLSREFSRLQTLARIVAREGTTDAARSPIHRMEDHWPRVELATIAEAYATSDARRLSALTQVRDHDRDHHSSYWPTLRTFVLCDRDFTEAAGRLNVHANTVRYRIERLKTVFGLDLADPATFFWVGVQVHHPDA